VWQYLNVADIRTSALGAVNVLVFVLLQCDIKQLELEMSVTLHLLQ